MASTTPKSRTPSDTADAPFMGSEYMDARAYLRQPARAKASDSASHGTNDSEFGVETEEG